MKRQSVASLTTIVGNMHRAAHSTEKTALNAMGRELRRQLNAVTSDIESLQEEGALLNPCAEGFARHKVIEGELDNLFELQRYLRDTIEKKNGVTCIERKFTGATL